MGMPMGDMAMPMGGAWAARKYPQALGHDQFAVAGSNSPFTKGQRKRLNIVAILFALLAPWLLFCFVFAVLSFGMHYQKPLVAYTLIGLALVIGVAVPCITTAERKRRHGVDRPWQDRTWHIFVTVTCALAFVVAAVAGEYNYVNFMKPYYDLAHLHHYHDIDTNLYVGQQLMDAGGIDFKSGTSLDVGRSMGFKNHDLYCVAPIVTKGSPNTPVSVDFWAVGKNCCNGYSPDFHCSGFNDPDSRGAIRLINDADRPFYRLAVQQAEATYKMTASHPLFFEWVKNTDEGIGQYAQVGRVNFFFGICAYLLLQLFLTAIAAVVFSTMVHF